MGEEHELRSALDTVVGALSRHRIKYFITGSVASSIQGEYRATNDVDIVADVAVGDLESLIRDLDREFVADVDQARMALTSQAAFNLIHRDSYLKVDIFSCVSAFDRESLRRAETIDLPGTPSSYQVATKEDILLSKLAWYRRGGEESDVQRRDIRGLIALNRDAFDAGHLQRWSAVLGVDDLLARFLAE